MSRPETSRPPRWAVGALSLCCCALALVVLLRPEPPPPIDEPAIFAEGDRLAEEGARAYRRWARACQDGTPPQEVTRLRDQALATLQDAHAKYSFVLDRHRGPDGYVDPAFEGHEERVSAIQPYLADLARSP